MVLIQEQNIAKQSKSKPVGEAKSGMSNEGRNQEFADVSKDPLAESPSLQEKVVETLPAQPPKKMSKLQLLAKEKAAKRAVKTNGKVPNSTTVIQDSVSPSTAPEPRPSTSPVIATRQLHFEVAEPSPFSLTLIGTSESSLHSTKSPNNTHHIAGAFGQSKAVQDSFLAPSPDDLVKIAKTGKA